MVILILGADVMAALNYGRHLPAFVLLFLAKGSTYGSAIMNQMKESMPYYFADSPAIYRTLSELENAGAVICTWDTSSSGAAKKCYTITEIGFQKLDEFKNDAEKRKKNLEFFLSELETLGNRRMEQ